MRFRFLALSLVLSALALAPAVQADPPPSYPGAQQDYLEISGGIFNTLYNNSNTSVQFGAEYRFHEWAYGVRPTLGVLGNFDGGLYGYGGFNWEIPLMSNRLFLVPSIMVGGYAKGSGKDLGGPLEFREGLELAYQFPNQQRLGLQFTHMSNASIYDHNPGVEALLVTYALPTSYFSR
jgi:lipid A 3-O-deacylase